MLEDRRLLDAASLIGLDASDIEYVQDEILIKLRESAIGVGRASATPSNSAIDDTLGTLLATYGGGELQPVFSRFSNGSVTDRELAEGGMISSLKTSSIDPEKIQNLSLWYRLELTPGVLVSDAVAAFQADMRVDYVGPNYVWRPAILPGDDPDPNFNTIDQWYHFSTHITQAWQHLEENTFDPGGFGVVVAVIDTGVDYNHQDLVGNMWINSGETPGNGIDDDGNGYVDDLHGANVVANTPAGEQGDPSDPFGHGTHVAGIIAATSFNDVGGVGVAYNSQIMAIRASAPELEGGFSETDVVNAIYYAVDNGADVINMSFGGTARSLIVEEALKIAANHATLIAAAGNKSTAADERPFYPAALPWVLGVMASDQDGNIADFSNYDDRPNSSYEYELAAPGNSIFSTLPGDQYAAWSGTSMAAPIVSGIAALLRTRYYDPNLYRDGFIMAQIANTLTGMQGGTPGEPAGVVDALAAMTTAPIPSVSTIGSWIFDSTSIDANNDEDGRIDSGETIHLGIELFNRAGPAELVSATLRAVVNGSGDDPNVTINTGTIVFGSIEPFSSADNSLIRDAAGVPTAASDPFVVTVDSNTLNGHVIKFELSTTFENGWDPEDTTVYIRTDSFEYIVQRGTELPPEIIVDTTLTAEDYWIISRDVSIASGATLTIEPGTHVQWGAISEDPYDPGQQHGALYVRGSLVVQGTAEAPVSLFPLAEIADQTTLIYVDGGVANLSYAKVRNPNLIDITGGDGFHSIDHAYFDWEANPFIVQAISISNTIFHQAPNGGSEIRSRIMDTILFDAGQLGPNGPNVHDFCASYLFNSTFLQESHRNVQYSLNTILTHSRLAEMHHAQTYGDTTYALLRVPCIITNHFYHLSGKCMDLNFIAPYAEYFGGHIVTISDEAEQQLVQTYYDGRPPVSNPCLDSGSASLYIIGLEDSLDNPGVFTWHNGEAINYTNWPNGTPPEPTAIRHLVYFANPWEVIPANVLGDWRPITLLAILELPGTVTEGDLLSANASPEFWQYLSENIHGPYQYNAFLNPYWDFNIDHWMRITPQVTDPNSHSAMINNYWGTDDLTLIDHMIYDFYDNATMSRIDYGVPPSEGYPSTYPFIQSVLIDGESAESQPTIGAGTKTFTLSFNREMDTSVDPYVTFGPAVAGATYSDYRVEPSAGGWIDPRTWKGEFTITPVTGDGFQYLQMSGAVAADDPWLVTGMDVARFRFNVETLGVGALTLTASGAEGRIDLEWTEDEFDLLAGYNVYRADAIDGTYTKINDAPILADSGGQVLYKDYDVLPAVPMFYKFTVLQSDLQESVFSNIASSAAMDTIPPVLLHEPVTSWPAGMGLRLTAIATDNVQVDSVTLYYRLIEGPIYPDYTPLSMANVPGNDEWSATIPASTVQSPGIEYYIVAMDNAMLQDSIGNSSAPFTVVVDAIPALFTVTPNEGTHWGGQSVTLSGTLFQEGAIVSFGGIQASDVIVVSAKQITAKTPPHFPALVDVAVTNPDSSQATLLNGYKYIDQSVMVSIATTLTAEFGNVIAVPIYVENASGLLSGQIEISYNPVVLSAQSVVQGNLISEFGWSFVPNLTNPGTIIISMAGINAVSGDGTLIIINFLVEGDPSCTTDLTFTTASFNDIELSQMQLSHGLFTVMASVDVSGNVTYYHGGGPVPNTDLVLVGVGIHTSQTDDNGVFSITDVLTGTYTLTPSKTNDAGTDAITEADASKVLRVAAGLDSPLIGDEIRAADVNRDGTVGPMDASYILQYSVALIGPQFPGAGKIWDFNPANRGYPLLDRDQTDQNFTAILIGDVTGNWTAPGTSGSGTGNGVRLWLPTVEGNVGSQITLPLWIERNAADVLSVGLVFAYDPSLLSIANTGVTLGAAATGMAYAANTSEDGIVRVGLAGTQPLVADGILLELNFTIDAVLAAPTIIDLQSGRINEGAIQTELLDGLVVAVGRLADFDTDGDVDSDDLNHWQTGFGNPSGAILEDGDANGDGDVDGNDFLIWQQNYGNSTTSGSGSCLAMVSERIPFANGETVMAFSTTDQDIQLLNTTPLTRNEEIRAQQQMQPMSRKVVDRIWEGSGRHGLILPIRTTPFWIANEPIDLQHDHRWLNQQPGSLIWDSYDAFTKDRLRSRSRQPEANINKYDKVYKELFDIDDLPGTFLL